MPKITTLKIELAKVKYEIAVNCNSGGQFTVRFPKEVSLALQLEHHYIRNTLDDITGLFHDARKRYETRTTTQELVIGITYAACGDFVMDSKGIAMFSQHGDSRYMEISYRSANIDALGFSYVVCIKETINGKPTIHEAHLGEDYTLFHQQEVDFDPKKWYKHSDHGISDEESYKFIPFSETALQTLKTAHEKIRQLSEMIFKFIDQDEKMIERVLIKNKFLN